MSNIFQELLSSDEDCETVANRTMEELLSDTRRKSYKKRSIAKLIFRLGPNVQFGVEMYNLIR